MDDIDAMLRDAGVGDTPPSASAGSPDPAPAPKREAPKLTPKWRDLRQSLSDLYTAGSVAAFALGDAHTAQVISDNSDACVDAWIELAQKDSKVADFLTKITTGSAWGAVVMAHAGIILPILARRGILPGGALFGAFAGDGEGAASPSQPSPSPLFAVDDSGVVTVDGHDNGNGAA